MDRRQSSLDVEPATSGTVPAEPLAPDAYRLAGGGDGDLAVVAVNLIERRVARGVGVDVTGGLRRSVGDLYGRAPGDTAVGRTPVPDVPVVGAVAFLLVGVRRLHVPEAIVAVTVS